MLQQRAACAGLQHRTSAPWIPPGTGCGIKITEIHCCGHQALGLTGKLRLAIAR